MRLIIMDRSSRYPDELLKSVDDSKEGRWVTVKDESSPLHGRHLFISGSGKILKGHGIPKHVVDKLNEKGGHNAVKHEPAQPHEMSMKDYRALPENQGKHPDNVRVGWLHSMAQAVRKNGKGAIPKHVYEAEPWLEPYIDNDFKTPRKAPEKIAGKGFPFSKVQNERNNEFLNTGNYLLNRGNGWGSGSGLSLEQKALRDILHKEGYDAAIKYLDGRATMSEKGFPEIWKRLRQSAADHKAQGEGLAPGEEKPAPAAPKQKLWAGPKDIQKHSDDFAKKAHAGDHVKLSQAAMDDIHSMFPELKGQVSDGAMIKGIDKDRDNDSKYHQYHLSLFSHDGSKILKDNFPATAKDVKFHAAGYDRKSEPKGPKLADHNQPLKLKSNKTDSILKAYGKHIYDHTVENQGSYDFSEHPAHNLGGRKDAAYDHAIDAIVNADDFEDKLKKTGKMSKSRELSDYDDDDLRERASQLLEEHMDSLEGTLNKSLDLHQARHALVIPRKLAPVETEKSDPKI